LQAVGDRPALQPPLAQEGTAALRDLTGAVRIDHVGVVGGDLVGQLLRCVRQEIPVLVHDPYAIDAVRFVASVSFAGAGLLQRRQRRDAQFPRA
jgi:hypothetical protein